MYTDIKRMQLMMEQLKEWAYVHDVNVGHYPNLTVEETFRFYMALANDAPPIDNMLELFNLLDERNTRVKNLSESPKNCLAFLRPFLFTKNFVVIEEPFNRLDEEFRHTMIRLIIEMVESGKSILLLSSNLEELSFVTEDIYR